MVLSAIRIILVQLYWRRWVMLNQVWCVDCVGRSINSSVPLRAQSYSFSNVVIKRLCLIIKYWNATELSYLEVVLYCSFMFARSTKNTLETLTITTFDVDRVILFFVGFRLYHVHTITDFRTLISPYCCDLLNFVS